MRNIMRKAPILLMLLTGILLAAACDTLEQDTAPDAPESLQLSPSDKNIFISPGGEAIIDLRNSLKVRSNALLEIGSQPGKGSLEFLENGLLKYAANKSFTSGNDSFVLNILKGTTLLDRDTIRIKIPSDTTHYPCSTGAVGDHVYIHPDSLAGGSVFFNIRKNDFMCDSSAYKLKLHTPPSYGKAEINGDYLQYTLGPDFPGYDKLIYQLCETSSEKILNCSLAEVSFQASGIVKCETQPDAKNDYHVIFSDSVRTDSTHYRKVINVLNNDFRCQELTRQYISKTPDVGAAYLDDSLLYYTYPKDFIGTDSLKYTICQSGSVCDEASVFIEIK